MAAISWQFSPDSPEAIEVLVARLSEEERWEIRDVVRAFAKTDYWANDHLRTAPQPGRLSRQSIRVGFAKLRGHIANVYPLGIALSTLEDERDSIEERMFT